MAEALATTPNPRFYALKRLMREFLAHRRTVSIIVFLGFVVAAIQPACLAVTQRIIDELQHPGSTRFFQWVPAFLAVVFLVSGLAKYFNNSLRRMLSERVVIKLRAELYRKYVGFPLSILDRKRTGDMMSSLQNDLAQVSVGIDTVCDLFKEPLIFLGLIGMAFYLDWRLTLGVLVAAPLVATLFSRSGAAVKRYANHNMEQFSELVSLSQESITGARVVKIFQLESTLLDKFRGLQEAYFRTIWKSIRVQELGTPLVELIGACLMGGVILYGRYRVTQGDMTTGKLIAFILDIGLAQMPLKQVNNAFLKLKNAEAAAERIYGVLDTPDRVPSGTRRWQEFQTSIVYDNITLEYGDKPALENVSFEVKRGECVAFVGPSGSGKSSIVNLLPRLYEVSGGRLLVDGVDSREIYLSDIRRQISVVTQDTFLFNDSIYENIRYGNPHASREAILRAAEMAHCLPFIEKLPQGMESRIGERGVCLSGGERQRLAIARALLKAAPILILDEATSSLDSHSEEVVQKALEVLMKGKTTFLVAHRFSTIRRADRIYVMEHGRISEAGGHDALMGGKGLYSRLYETQMGSLI
jgi:subfamily B ATP-binding cassette protein MsbA